MYGLTYCDRDGVFDVLSDQLAADIAQMVINDLCMLPGEAIVVQSSPLCIMRTLCV